MLFKLLFWYFSICFTRFSQRLTVRPQLKIKAAEKVAEQAFHWALLVLNQRKKFRSFSLCLELVLKLHRQVPPQKVDVLGVGVAQNTGPRFVIFCWIKWNFLCFFLFLLFLLTQQEDGDLERQKTFTKNVNKNKKPNSQNLWQFHPVPPAPPLGGQTPDERSWSSPTWARRTSPARLELTGCSSADPEGTKNIKLFYYPSKTFFLFTYHSNDKTVQLKVKVVGRAEEHDLWDGFS